MRANAAIMQARNLTTNGGVFFLSELPIRKGARTMIDLDLVTLVTSCRSGNVLRLQLCGVYRVGKRCV